MVIDLDKTKTVISVHVDHDSQIKSTHAHPSYFKEKRKAKLPN